MLIDFQDKIELPDEMKIKFCNELQTLANIWQGMCLIYNCAHKIEQKANEGIRTGDGFGTMPPEVRKAFEGKDIRYFSAGNDPAFSWVDKGLLYCLFQWYAVSACNYVRLVGYLAKEIHPESQKPIDYVKGVIPEVQWFRNKIAAHPVMVFDDKDKRDNEADRKASVLYQVAFDNGRFKAPSWQVTIGSKGQQVSGTSPGPWSITEIHDKLKERYKGET